jgi:hypothetical protein
MDLKKLYAELGRCLEGWKVYEKDLIKQGLPGPLKPTAVGFKVADLAEFKSTVDGLLDLSEQLHVGTVNDRFIGTFVLKNPLDTAYIRLIKILQRRPGSDDPLGLDHIDFFIKDISAAEQCLATARANWEHESNEVHQWLSVRFGEDLQYEAKLLNHTSLSAGITEMKLAEDDILTRSTDKA